MIFLQKNKVEVPNKRVNKPFQDANNKSLFLGGVNVVFLRPPLIVRESPRHADMTSMTQLASFKIAENSFLGNDLSEESPLR